MAKRQDQRSLSTVPEHAHRIAVQRLVEDIPLKPTDRSWAPQVSDRLEQSTPA